MPDADIGPGTSHQLPSEVYDRAQRFLPWNAQRYAPNVEIDHHWIGTTDSFWYRQRVAAGSRFVVYDCPTRERRPAFDHAAVASALSSALNNAVDPENLPFEHFEFSADERSIRFAVESVTWDCDLSEGRCITVPDGPLIGVLSPDGQWLAFLKTHNLWVRHLVNGTTRQLTDDGEAYFGYGTFAGTDAIVGFCAENQQVPAALWSPDSTRLVTHRLDERQVLELDLLETVPADGVRPKRHSYRFAFPGDPHKPLAQLAIFDVLDGRRVDIQLAPIVVTCIGLIEDDRVWWSTNGTVVYVLPRAEGQQRAQLFAIDSGTGMSRVLIEELGRTYVEVGGTALRRDVRSLSDGRIVWYSERDNWGHLYLYDQQGALLRQLTHGSWKVLAIDHIDEGRGVIYFTAVGREPEQDPYGVHLYSVTLLGGEPTPMTPDAAHHEIRTADPALRRTVLGTRGPMEASFSPTGRYFVDTFSRPDLPSVTVVRDEYGRLIQELEKADISALEAVGVTLPEPFKVLAADNVTALFGTLYRPSTFDPSRSYPVIDVIYPGPHRIETPKDFKGALFYVAQELAELGFVVVNVDGRGTPLRSKSFHDVSYGDLGQAGNLEDHIACLKQLADRYPYMDLSRVGITGSSGGGYASTRAILQYPSFYKVAVSISGSHDQRAYTLLWGPTYHGPLGNGSYDTLANPPLVGNLQGKLLLIHGEMDYNAHPALTMRMVDALIKANKDFEFLMVPGEDHEPSYARWERFNYHVYILRKTWDFFVRHLLEREPPSPYAITGPMDRC